MAKVELTPDYVREQIPAVRHELGDYATDTAGIFQTNFRTYEELVPESMQETYGANSLCIHVGFRKPVDIDKFRKEINGVLILYQNPE